MIAAYLLLALLSGAPALVYQVVWTREVALLVGSQIEGISVVLAAFFGGLAAGARWLGIRADRVASPLRLYALLEAGAGLLAAASLALIRLLAREGAAIPAWALLVLGAVAILPVTFLLGGTLPVLLRAAGANALAAPRTAGALVAANTAGAVVGVGLAALGAPLYGLAATQLAAAAGSLALGVAAALLARSARLAARAAPPAKSPEPARGRGLSPWVLAAAALAGAATLGFEALAARGAALRLGSSLLAWTWVLSLVLVGLAAGNGAFARASTRSSDPARDLGWIEAAAALALTLSLAALRSDPTRVAEGITGASLLGVAVALLPPVFLMGGAFPYFVRLAVADDERVGAAFGAVTAANTAGGIAGSLVFPLALLPALGLDGALCACVGANALLGAAFLARGGGREGWIRAATGVAPALTVAGVLVASPPPGGGQLLFFHHGRQSSAAVVRFPERGARDLYVDGDPEASTGGDARRTEHLLAAVPLLLHPAPRRFLEVGLGSGITLGTAARLPLERIDCVEISESVLRAARFFEPDNRGVASGSDPRVRIEHGDGRAFLARASGEYDVVVANTLHPWSVGATGLYSREYFERLAGALAEGGLAVQWLPVDGIGSRELSAVLRTFFGVFPRGAVYWGSRNVLLVGSEKRLPEWKPDADDARLLQELGLFDYLPLDSLRIARAATVRFVVGAEPVLSDDKPVLEVSSALARPADGSEEAVLLLEQLAAAGDRDSRTLGLRLWLESRTARRRDLDAKAESLVRAAANAGFSLARRELGLALVRSGEAELAAGRPGKAEALWSRALELRPGQREALLARATAADQRGDLARAAQGLRQLLSYHPSDALAWNRMADVLYRGGQTDAARRALDEAVRWDPYFPEALANAGLLALDAGEIATARQRLEQLAAATPRLELPVEQALREALAAAGGG